MTYKRGVGNEDKASCITTHDSGMENSMPLSFFCSVNVLTEKVAVYLLDLVDRCPQSEIIPHF